MHIAITEMCAPHRKVPTSREGHSCCQAAVAAPGLEAGRLLKNAPSNALGGQFCRSALLSGIQQANMRRWCYAWTRRPMRYLSVKNV